MSRHNNHRILAGGAVAGVVQYVIQGITNAGVLRHDWKAWRATVGTVIQLPERNCSLVYWFAESMVLGIVGVWLYVTFRPKYGVGPKTAVRAGLVIWLASWVTCLFHELAMGVVPTEILVINCIAGLVAAIASMSAGAFLYKEAA